MGLGIGVALCSVVLPDRTGANPYADYVDVRLVPGWVDPDGRHVAALEITLDEGWKTYWRAPGDAGVPPVFSWAASRNVAQVAVRWPRPEVFVQNGMRSIGYTNQVVIPLLVTPSKTGRDVRLDGKIQIGICSDICVPLNVRLDGLVLPASVQRVPAIAAALADQPFAGHEVGLRKAICRVSVGKHGVALEAEMSIPSSGREEVVVVEIADPDVYVAEAKVTRKGRILVAQTELMRMDGKMFAIDRSLVRLTILGSEQAVDIQGCTAG